jgi:hypothetical protein
VEKTTHTWLSSFAHEDVDNAAAGDLLVQAHQFISNTEECEGVRGAFTRRKNCCRSCPIAAPHATPQYERDQRERIPLFLLSLLYNNLHPGGRRASIMHRDTKARRVEISFVGYQYCRFVEVVSVALDENGHALAHVFSSVPVLLSVIQSCPPRGLALGVLRCFTVILTAVNVAARLSRESLYVGL